MTPDQATFLLNEIYLPQLRNEHKTTRRLIEALPHDKGDYKPSDLCMSAWELATHIATSQIFFLNGIANGKFERGAPLPDSIKTPEQLLEWDEENFGKALDKVAAMSPEALASDLSFFGYFMQPAVTYAGFMSSHTIHHRGQLSSYLRPMGAKVPRIYGGSADEPMPAPPPQAQNA
jgi:uncharacterized damage-inducible protein DinB